MVALVGWLANSLAGIKAIISCSKFTNANISKAVKSYCSFFEIPICKFQTNPFGITICRPFPFLSGLVEYWLVDLTCILIKSPVSSLVAKTSNA